MVARRGGGGRVVALACGVLAIFAGASTPAEAGAGDPAFVGTEQAAEMILSSSDLGPQVAPVSSVSEGAAVEAARDQALELIDATGDAFFRVLYPAGLDPAQVRNVRRTLGQVAIYFCESGCRCSLLESPVCSFSRQRADLVASAILVHPCIMEVGGKGCPDKKYKKAGARASALVNGFVDALSMVAVVKAQGLEETASNRKVRDLVAGTVKRLSARFHAVMERCPGPYPASARRLFEELGALKPISGFADQCAQSLVNLLRVKSLPARCQRVIDPALWRRFAAEELFRSSVTAWRCGSLCEWATGCLAQEKGSAARVIPFESNLSIVSVPLDACDGARPRDPVGFVEGWLARVAIAAVLSGAQGARLLQDCAKDLASRLPASAQPMSVESTAPGNGGVDIQLIE